MSRYEITHIMARTFDGENGRDGMAPSLEIFVDLLVHTRGPAMFKNVI